MSLAALLLASLAVVPQSFPRLSPFDGLRWNEDVPEVRVGDDWYLCRAVDDVACDEILAFARRTWPDRWQKRFGEDLVEVLARMGHEPGTRVDLALATLDDEEPVVLRGVEMTREKREAIRTGAVAVERVKREHSGRVRDEDRVLVERLPSPGPRIPRALVEADLGQLEWWIEHRYSYRDLTGVDFRAALDSIRAALEEGIDRDSLALQVARLIARFGDGHTRVDGLERFLPGGYLPFLVETAGGQPLAFLADRSGFVDPEHEVLVALDGVPLERWREVAASTVARGSGPFVERFTLRNLRLLNWLRGELGLPLSSGVEVTLSSLDGGSTVTRTLEVADRKPIHGEWPRTRTELLDGRIGYLRIPSMSTDADDLRRLREALERFQGTKGLIVDVRGNSGGSRDALVELYPWFLPKREPAVVANVAAYRLGPGDPARAPDGYLANRGLYPESWGGWSKDAKKALAKASKRFRPEWLEPEDAFSELHWFVLERPDDRVPHYDEPVIVLQDAGCFSATDVFLGAFSGRKGVTLMGTPSGGGSGRTQPVVLANSGIPLAFSSMASFRPDGSLYDGRGVAPDIVLEPEPGYLIGASDAVLEAALARLRD